MKTVTNYELRVYSSLSSILEMATISGFAMSYCRGTTLPRNLILPSLRVAHYLNQINLIIIALYVFSWNVITVLLAQSLPIASGCPISWKSVTHNQAEWSVITFPVQAIHCIIWYTWHSIWRLSFSYVKIITQDITQLCDMSTIIALLLMREDTEKKCNYLLMSVLFLCVFKLI